MAKTLTLILAGLFFLGLPAHADDIPPATVTITTGDLGQAQDLVGRILQAKQRPKVTLIRLKNPTGIPTTQAGKNRDRDQYLAVETQARRDMQATAKGRQLLAKLGESTNPHDWIPVMEKFYGLPSQGSVHEIGWHQLDRWPGVTVTRPTVQ